jgi:hypothetical protein
MDIDSMLKPIAMDEPPSLDDLIVNLNYLQGLFISRQQKKCLATVYWAEQVIKGNVNGLTIDVSDCNNGS